jgi:uncharacterized iron-regulated protein
MTYLVFILGMMVFRPATEPPDSIPTPKVTEIPDYKPAYRLYDTNGNTMSWAKLIDLASANEVVFFGELHNNAISHWLQLELVKALASDSTRTLSLGFEMFEADQQVLLDEYTAGLISTTNFEREARLWNNYKTDIKPLVEFGRSNRIPLIATNIPRRYASAVYSGGLEALDALSEEAKQWMMPLPVEVDLSLPGYANIMEAAGGHGGVNLPYSQAVKDATMAHFTLQHLPFNGTFVHFNGRYHSDNYEGILWYIAQERPDTRILTITTVEANEPDHPDSTIFGTADVIIVVDRNMTKTH